MWASWHVDAAVAASEFLAFGTPFERVGPEEGDDR